MHLMQHMYLLFISRYHNRKCDSLSILITSYYHCLICYLSNRIIRKKSELKSNESYSFHFFYQKKMIKFKKLILKKFFKFIKKMMKKMKIKKILNQDIDYCFMLVKICWMKKIDNSLIYVKNKKVVLNLVIIII